LRTSNPGSGAFQGLSVTVPDAEVPAAASEPLAHRIARIAGEWQRHPGTLGLVVGATAPTELAAIRAISPELPFLVPGLGSQGGDLEATRISGPVAGGPAVDLPGGALLVNVSRGIATAAIGADDPEAAVAAAAADWGIRLRC
jgi:orotidine-5'-phosphate decarboxylase